MKKTFLILLLPVWFCGCHTKEQPAPKKELPPETQTGAGTMGCYVNGQLWLREYPMFTGIGRGVQVSLNNGEFFCLLIMIMEKTVVR